MSWKSGDLYHCLNPECASKVLVLEPPRGSVPVQTPRCVCGHPFQRVSHGVQDPVRAWTD